MLIGVATRETAAAIGARRSRMLRHRVGDELSAARRTAGLSLRELGRKVGVSAGRIARAELGDASALTIDLAARIAPFVGLQLATSLHPYGDPVRDRAHLALIARFRARLHAVLRWRTEVPMPIAGDPRAADGMIDGPFGSALVEAETNLGDIQALERKVAAKQRDIGADRVILLVADTRHNREVINTHPEIRERFPIDTRSCLGKLARGLDPGGDCLVIL